MDLLQTLKPSIPKRYLLLVAALVWTFAGGMLLFKGIALFFKYPELLVLKISISVIGGGLFYLLLFSKISNKHIKRILNIEIDSPCFFSFFNVRSYVLMTIMIGSGILLKKFGVISPEYLSIIDVTMGMPLFLSAFRFYTYGFTNLRATSKANRITG
jgi:hypothetical protein